MARQTYVHRYGSPRLLLFSAVLLVVSAAVLVCGQSGFLNIDCGKDETYKSNDSRTGLLYTSDHQYVSTGEIHKVSSATQQNIPYYLQALDLRSFPNGTRNCYTLPVTPNRKYLLRAIFMYGNYNEYNHPPQFALYVGVNYWTTINIQGDGVFSRELIFVVSDRWYMNLCLVDTGGGTPFISGLELRPLQDEVYPQANASQALQLADRRHFGRTDATPVRYPKDKYDRVWFQLDTPKTGYETLTAPSPVIVDPIFKVPSEVLSTALSPVNDTTLNYILDENTHVEESFFHVYFHFAELKKINTTDDEERREFDIIINDEMISGAYSPTYLKGQIIPNPNPMKNNTVHCMLTQTDDSTLPPILNALEVYQIKSMTGVETEQQDVHAIIAIKKAYQVLRNWQGDPCSPKEFTWEGLDC